AACGAGASLPACAPGACRPGRSVCGTAAPPQAKQNKNANTQFNCCMSSSPLAAKPDPLPPKNTLQLKVDFKSRESFGPVWSTRCEDRDCADLECRHAGMGHFRGCTPGWAPSVSDSLLRANWSPASRPASERAETI